jgi:hypothetical protein
MALKLKLLLLLCGLFATVSLGDIKIYEFNDGTQPTSRATSLAFSDLAGTATDAQIPNNITVTLAATATAVANHLTGSASLDFADPSASTCTAEQTITVSGADVGDVVMLGIPSITISANQFFPSPRVSASNTVAIKFCEGATVTNNPAAGTYTVVVID